MWQLFSKYNFKTRYTEVACNGKSLPSKCHKTPLMRSQHFFGQRFGVDRAISHYLDQCWPNLCRHYATINFVHFILLASLGLKTCRNGIYWFRSFCFLLHLSSTTVTVYSIRYRPFSYQNPWWIREISLTKFWGFLWRNHDIGNDKTAQDLA